jgi:MFS family permease
VKLQILACLLVLTCGQVLFWHRRDNVLGYMQGAVFLTTVLLPVLGTTILDEFADHTVKLYADLLLVGAAGYLGGMFFGALIGSRPHRHHPRLIFAQPIEGKLQTLVLGRARLLALFGSLALIVGFYIVGYAPLFAQNRQLAKYGVGAYAAGFQKGAIVYRLGLAVGSTALSVILAVLLRRRRLLDLSLALLVMAGLVLSLSRALAFTGLLLATVAWAVEKKMRPVTIVTLLSFAFILGALSNELLFPSAPDLGSLSRRVAAGTPDIRDNLGFLRGFELAGHKTSAWALIASGLSLSKGYYDPSAFALRTINGGASVEGVPSGGLRLPAPVWGYVSFGYAGAWIWSVVAGIFMGYGTTRMKRLLTDISFKPGAALNMTLAAVFFTGTYGVLSSFYFTSSSMFVQLALALYLGYTVFETSGRRYPAGEPSPPEPRGKLSRLNR